jgi:glucan phosphoethanolaminetransferase (alkaline phosphatase superfamily)
LANAGPEVEVGKGDTGEQSPKKLLTGLFWISLFFLIIFSIILALAINSENLTLQMGANVSTILAFVFSIISFIISYFSRDKLTRIEIKGGTNYFNRVTNIHAYDEAKVYISPSNREGEQ